MGAQSKDMADATWKEVDGGKTAQARKVATGYQDPDLRNGNVDFAGCVWPIVSSAVDIPGDLEEVAA